MEYILNILVFHDKCKIFSFFLTLGIKNPWGWVELAGLTPPLPSGSEDEGLENAVPAIYTRSLFSLSPGHLPGDKDEEVEDEEEVEAKQNKKRRIRK